MMSSRRPIIQIVRDSARRARNILKMTDPHEIGVYCHGRCVELGVITEEWRLDAQIQAIMKLITLRTPKGPSKSERQLHLFMDCDDINYNIRNEDRVYQKALGDFGVDDIDLVVAEQRSNIDQAVAANELFVRAASFVVPLLEQNQGWVWRDAVAHMAKRDGLPTL